MADDKHKAFLAYKTWYRAYFKEMSQEEKGLMLDKMYEMHITLSSDDFPFDKTTQGDFCEDYMVGDRFLDSAIRAISEALYIDELKHREKRMKNSENGKLGGAPKGNKNASKNNRTVEQTTERLNKQAKQPDIDIDKDMDMDMANDKAMDIDIEKDKDKDISSVQDKEESAPRLSVGAEADSTHDAEHWISVADKMGFALSEGTKNSFRRFLKEYPNEGAKAIEFAAGQKNRDGTEPNHGIIKYIQQIEIQKELMNP